MMYFVINGGLPPSNPRIRGCRPLVPCNSICVKRVKLREHLTVTQLELSYGVNSGRVKSGRVKSGGNRPNQVCHILQDVQHHYET